MKALALSLVALALAGCATLPTAIVHTQCLPEGVPHFEGWKATRSQFVEIAVEDGTGRPGLMLEFTKDDVSVQALLLLRRFPPQDGDPMALLSFIYQGTLWKDDAFVNSEADDNLRVRPTGECLWKSEPYAGDHVPFQGEEEDEYTGHGYPSPYAPGDRLKI